MRLLRNLLIVAVVLAGGAFFAIKIFLPPAKLKAIAIEKLQASLHREVKIGSIGLAMRGLDARGVEISEPGGFGAGSFIKADELIARIKLRPLLNKRVELSELAFSNWTCRIRPAEGSASVKDAAAAPATKAPARAEHSTPSKISEAAPAGTKAPSGDLKAFLIDRITSHNGTVYYQDASRNEVTVKNIDADAHHVQVKSEIPLTLSLDYSGRMGKSELNGSINFRGTLALGGLEAAKMAVTFKPLKLGYNGLRAELSGEVSDFAAPKADLKFESPEHTAQQLKSLATLPAWLGSVPALNGSVKLKSSRGATELQALEINSAAAKNPGGPEIPAIRIIAAGAMQGDLISIRKADIKAGDLAASISGSVRSSDGGRQLELRIKTNRFPLYDLAGFFPAAKDLRLRGGAALALQVRGKSDAPALFGDADLKDVSFSYSGQSFDAINGAAHFSPEAVNAQVRGAWNKSEFSITAGVQDYQKAPKIKVEGNLAQLDIAHANELFAGSMTKSSSAKPSESAPAKTASAPKSGGQAGGKGVPEKNESGRSSGKITIGKIVHPNFSASNLQLVWFLDDLDPAHLNGSAQLNIGEGKFDNLKGLAGESAAARVALMPIIILQSVASLVKVPLFPAFDRVHFKEITGNYRFHNGMMTVKESHINSDVAYVSTTGSVDLAREQLDLRVSTKLGSQVGIELNGPLGFTVKGPISSPSVKVDLASILKQPIVNDAVEQGKKLLNQLFK